MGLENLISGARLFHFPNPTSMEELISNGKELGAQMGEGGYLLIRNNIQHLPPSLIGATIIFPETGTESCRWTIRTWKDEGSICAELGSWHGPEKAPGMSLLKLGE